MAAYEVSDALSKIAEIRCDGKSGYRSLIARLSLPPGTDVLKERPIAVIAVGGDILRASKELEEGGQTTAYISLEEKAMSHIDSICTDTGCDARLLKLIIRVNSWYVIRSRCAGSECGLSVDASSDSVMATSRAFDLLCEGPDSKDKTESNPLVAAMRRLAPLLPFPDCKKDEEMKIMHLLRISYRINSNSYGIVSPCHEGTSTPIGVGLFPLAGISINHSCSPNLYFSWNKEYRFMQYRTIKEVPAGEELTVAYCDLFNDTMARRRQLLESRCFECACAKCAAYMSFDHSLRQSIITGAKEFTIELPVLSTSSVPANPTDDLDSLIDELCGDFGEAKVGNGKSSKDGKAAKKSAAKKLTKGFSSSSSSSSSKSKIIVSKELLADLQLVAYSCSKCTSGGVSLRLDDKTAKCLSCGHMERGIQPSVYTCLENKYLAMKKNPSNAALVEAFLREFDPLYASTYGSSTKKPDTLFAKRMERKLLVGVKLHSCNKFIVNALTYHLGNLRQRGEKGSLHIIVALAQRICDCYAAVLPPLHAHIASLKIEVADDMKRLCAVARGGAGCGDEALLRDQATRIYGISLGREHVKNKIM